MAQTKTEIARLTRSVKSSCNSTRWGVRCSIRAYRGPVVERVLQHKMSTHTRFWILNIVQKTLYRRSDSQTLHRLCSSKSRIPQKRACSMIQANLVQNSKTSWTLQRESLNPSLTCQPMLTPQSTNISTVWSVTWSRKGIKSSIAMLASLASTKEFQLIRRKTKWI